MTDVHSGDLFASPPAIPRLSDPAVASMGAHHSRPQRTEFEAASLVQPKTGTQRMRVLEALVLASNGLTDVEVAATTGIYLYSAAPRRVELMKGGWVEDSGQTRDTGHGGHGIVWTLTAAARAALASGEQHG